MSQQPPAKPRARREPEAATTSRVPPLQPGSLPNYSLSTVCPRCHAPTVRRACKVRCDQCGFMWDCSEL